MRGRLAGYPLLLIVAALLFGCGGDETPAPKGESIVMSIYSHGGLCPYGGCARTTVLLSDGTYVVVEDSQTVLEGAIDPALLSRLVGALKAANFNDLRSTPFKDVCPTAFDGAERVFSFYVDGRVEQIATCDTVVDFEAEPFLSVGLITDAIFD